MRNLRSDKTYWPTISLDLDVEFKDSKEDFIDKTVTQICDKGVPFSATKWRCHDGLHIPVSQVCDNVDNCLDSSDEEQILCKGSPFKYLSVVVICYIILGCLALGPLLLKSQCEVTDGHDTTEQCNNQDIEKTIKCKVFLTRKATGIKKISEQH